MGNRQNISVHYGRSENLEYKRINRIVIAKPTSDIGNKSVKLLPFKLLREMRLEIIKVVF